jgi:NTE family protein
VRPGYVVGTSIGAIIGALVASGYDARQVDSIVRAADVAGVFREARPFAPRAFGAIEPVLTWEQGRGGFGLVSASTLDARVNARLNDILLAGNLAAAGDFDSLPIPFTAIGATLVARRRVLLEHGDLARAVRTSMSIPLVFYPQVVDGRILVDGGIADNIPIAPARGRAGALVIVNVASAAGDTVDINSPTAVAAHLIETFMAESDDTVAATDLYIRPELRGIRMMDFTPVRMELARRLGAEAARSALARAPCVPAGGPRNRPPTGPFRLAGVSVTAPRAAERRYLRRAFGLVAGDTLDLARIRRAFRALERSAERREVWLNPRRAEDGLHLDVTLTPPPPRLAGLAFAYDYDQGGRFAAMMLDRTIADGAVQGSAGLTVGRYQQLLFLGVRPEPVSWNPVQPEARVRLMHEEVRRWDADGTERPTAETRDAVLFVGVERAGGAWLLQGGGVAGSWTDPAGTRSAVGGRVRAQRGTTTRLPAAQLDAMWTDQWRSVSVDVEGAVTWHRWTLGAAARGGAGHALPLQLTFPLGGARAFPGYHLGELRGDGEVFAQAAIGHRLFGPFSARVEVAAGRAWRSARDEWLGGARVTLEMPTPLGLLRGGYGRATTGRGAVFVRLGAWF